MKDTKHIFRDLQQGLGALFTFSEQDGVQRIRTPYLYPDGDNIDLFCEFDGDVVTVSDFAETTGWLRMQSTSPRRSLKQTQLIEDTCLTHGVEFYRGMLQARCRPGDDPADVVTRVAQAALRVSDLWFTFRTQGVQHVTGEVADLLAEHEFKFEREQKLVGRSGQSWTLDFHVRTERRSSLVLVLATGNRAAGRRISEHAVATWHDLNHFAVGPEALHFISLFDDTSEVWTDADYKMLEPLSEISHWSRPDQFTAALQAAT